MKTDPDNRTNGKGKYLMEEAGIECFEAKIYEAEKTQIAELENKKIAEAKDLDTKLSGFTLEIKVAVTEEEVMYGSIGTKEITESLGANGFEINRQSVRLPEGVLKDLGNFELDIELHPEVITKINVILKPEK